MKETFTTCRDLALKLADAGVPVRHSRVGGILRWFYPTWAGRAQQLLRAAGIPKKDRRAVLAALAHNVDRRARLRALDHAGDATGIRAFLAELAA